MATKLIISNLSALKRKYSAQAASVQTALKPVIDADLKMGITTQIIYVDVEEEMEKVGATPVSDAADCKQNKNAIDELYKYYKPDYMLLLGAPDIIPHQRLENPTPDDDPDVPSDLPYACDAAYSTKITHFLSPTRLVSRLPDITGIPAKEASYFLSVLAFAAQRTQRPQEDYLRYFSVSCEDWWESTAMSLRNIFPAAELTLYTSPSSGPEWSVDQLAPLSHFINCHGAPENPHFYGQKSDENPVAMSAEQLSDKLQPDTVTAAECCYGSQLYNPDAQKPSIHMGICNTYMLNGAKAFFGSSNIAWGPAAGNSDADLITQYFLIAILAGNSVGQAVLSARLQFVHNEDMRKPTALKTLASFNSMGDPVMVPVASIKEQEQGLDNLLALERAQSHSQALAIMSGKPYSERDDTKFPSPKVQKAIDDLLAGRKVKQSKQQTSVVQWPSALQVKTPEVWVHTVAFRDPDVELSAPFESHVIVEIKESAGSILSVEEFISK